MTTSTSADVARTQALHQKLAAAALFVFAAGYFAILAPYSLELADEGHLLHQIYRTYLGQLPYVDFHTGYSPAVYYLNAWLLHAFGLNLLVVRLALALVNTLCVLSTWWLAKHLGASPLASFLAGLAFIALIPFFDGQFAPFNIPYPAWYVTLFWQLAAVCIVCWWEKGHSLWWLGAGVLAGLVFAFKQNSGLLALAACLICLVLLQQPPRDDRGWLARLDRLARWSIPLLLTAGFFKLFGAFAPGSPAVTLVAPLAVFLLGFIATNGSSPARRVAPGAVLLDLLLLSAGFAVVNLPWLVYFWKHLGMVALLRAVFYVGSGYEQYYLIPYPGFARWGWPLVGVAVGLGLLPRLVRRVGLTARVALGLALLAAAAAALVLLRHPPPMVEGFQASVVMRMRDLSFTLVLVALWAGIAAYFVRTRRAHDSPVKGVHAVIVIAAVMMHMQVYPRSDFMHLVYAAPCALVLAAWLLDRWALELLGALGVPRRRRFLARALFESPAFAVAAVFLAPALLRVEYLARSWWTADPTALVRLGSPQAPLVVEPSAGRMFQSLSQTIRFVDEHTRPGDFVFTFPCLDTLTFLADRQDPSRHGYYYPGSPGHAVEAEVIDSLESTPPSYVVTLHDHALFFVGAPVYYFNLRDYVTAEFTPDRRFGLIDVLRRRGDAEGQGRVVPPQNGKAEDGDVADMVTLWQAELRHTWGGTARSVSAALERAAPVSVADLAAAIASSPPPEQRLIATLIQKSRSAVGAAALATVLSEPQLPEREFQLFVRIIGAVGDLRAVPPLLEGVDQVVPDRRPELAGNLFNIASKAWIERYFYAPDAAPLRGSDAGDIDSGRLINWMQNGFESPALRSFALRMAGHSRNASVVPFLVRVAGDGREMFQLRLDAAHSLVELGYGGHALAVLASLLRTDDMLAGALIAASYHQAPDSAREVLMAHLADPDDAVRTRAFWIAGAVRDPKLLPLLEKGLNDPVPEVRMAAVWVLGQMNSREAQQALAGLGPDPHDEVNAFVERARRR